MKKIVISLCMLVAIVVAPLVSQASTLADGKYSLPFQVNKGGSTSASYGNDYFVKPATLVIKNGQMYVQFTIKNSSWVTALNGSEGGNQVISTNAGADTRVVQFNISNPFGKTVVNMKVDIDELSYHHEYSVDFVWFGDKATLIESYAAPKVEQAKPQASAVTSQAPSTNSQPKQEPKKTEQKAVEKTKSVETTKPAETEKKEESVAVTETKQEKNEEKEAVPTEENDDKALEKKETEVVEKVKPANDKAQQAIEPTNESSSTNVVWIILSIVVVIILVGGFIAFRKKSKVA